MTYRITIHVSGCKAICIPNQTLDELGDFLKFYHADSIAPMTLNPTLDDTYIINRSLIGWIKIEKFGEVED